MKTYPNLWTQILAWPNLQHAARKAQRGKRRRPCVLRFNDVQEAELHRLRDELARQTYAPGGFRSFWIQQPKPRLISAAPYRDRVVHHALMNVLEPILERHFHPHSYACRQGRGTHAAADRLQGLMQRRRYALQMDVRKFFPSLDHELLKGLFRRRVRDERVLWLMDRIVDTSNEQHGPMEWFAGDDLFTPCHRRRGLPIGNLTSQWFANWYLTPLDFFVTHELRLGDYVRYCDDLVVLSDDRDRLREAASQIGDFLAGWRLRVHPGKTAVTPVRAGLRFVGFRIWPTHRLLRKENIKAFRRRVRWIKAEYAAGRLDYVEDIRPRIASWLGHARQANSRMLIRRLSREWVFRRDPGISDEQK